GDALRRLTDQTTYLYQDGRRYWYSKQPSVAQLARDRAAQQRDEDVFDEIRHRLREETRNRAAFTRVYSCVPHSEIGDEDKARLDTTAPREPHAAKNMWRAAITAALQCLDNHGTAPRLKRNTLVFLAADRTRLEDLKKAVRDFLAWQSIERDSDT